MGHVNRQLLEALEWSLSQIEDSLDLDHQAAFEAAQDALNRARAIKWQRDGYTLSLKQIIKEERRTRKIVWGMLNELVLSASTPVGSIERQRAIKGARTVLERTKFFKTNNHARNES